MEKKLPSRLCKLVYPTPLEVETRLAVDKDTRVILNALSKSTKLPLEVVMRVLTHLGMPHFTPELAKALREERIRYMKENWKPRKRGFLKKLL